MSTDATGLPSDVGGAINTGLNAAASSVASAGARHVRSLDERLTLIGVRATYVSFSFFFACFFFAIVYLQLVNENGLWLPKGIDHPASALGVIETAAVLLAGLAYFWGQWGGLYQRNFARLSLGLWAAAILCLISVITHIIELHSPGFSLQGGGYVSCFVALEGTLTALLVVVTVILFGVANRARLGLFAESGVAIEAFGEFVGWMSAIALMTFLALYVQPFFPSGG
ncbi:MAG TPA: hypothetical protein VF898_08125 [Chloroflexota bacterium]